MEHARDDAEKQIRGHRAHVVARLVRSGFDAPVVLERVRVAVDTIPCEAVQPLVDAVPGALAGDVADRGRGDGEHPGGAKPYSPFGFPHHAPTGGMVVMQGNTPDNSLPLIHWRSSKWCPIFPRHSRV